MDPWYEAVNWLNNENSRGASQFDMPNDRSGKASLSGRSIQAVQSAGDDRHLLFKCMCQVPSLPDPDLQLLSRLIRNPLTGILYRHRFQMVLDLISLPVDRVLEIGYGAGFLAYTLAPHVCEYVGIDIHPYTDEVAKVLKKQGISDVVLRRGDARYLTGIPENSLNLVVSVSCLEHIKERDEIQKEVFRVLKPGGRAVYGMPVKNFISQVLFRLVGYDDDVIHPSTPQDVVASAQSQGLIFEHEAFFPSGTGHRFGLYWAGCFIKTDQQYSNDNSE